MSSYVSLFSSSGIGCFGLKQIGFECIATLELIEKRLNIQRYNNKCQKESGYICGDITLKSTYDKLFNEINEYKKHNHDIDVVIATPPCQGMSVANHGKNDELKRNSLVVESLRIIKNINPKYFILENVRSFLKTTCTDSDGINKPIIDAIEFNLDSTYNITSKVLNLKNYGSNSSRTRTIVIGVRNDIDTLPIDLFPDYVDEPLLGDVIGHLPKLSTMGEFSPDDIFHSFRPYKKDMERWVSATPYGQSAFDNADVHDKPHKIVDGKIVINAQKNSDKYQRQRWENVAACVHTRSDCLGSQNTIHPTDNRVFSIRELMLMMTIPETFKWVPDSVYTPGNNDTYEVKDKFRKKYDTVIRQCIGEAVPTEIFKRICLKIQNKQ